MLAPEARALASSTQRSMHLEGRTMKGASALSVPLTYKLLATHSALVAEGLRGRDPKPLLLEL